MKRNWLILLWAVFACSGQANNATLPTAVTGISVIDQKSIHLDTKDKLGLVVVFLSAKCPCSDSHTTELKELKTDFKEFNFVGVHSNANETTELSAKYFKGVNLPFPVIQDSQSRWADQFKALKTPHAFVVLKDGTLAYQGGVTNSRKLASADRKFLREALTDLQSGRGVKTPEGRTLGCVIERGEKNVW